MFGYLKKIFRGEDNDTDESANFEVQIGRGVVVYSERGHKYLINASPENKVCLLDVDHMGDVDWKVDSLPAADKLRIAKNIRSYLRKKNVEADVIYEHRLIRDE